MLRRITIALIGVWAALCTAATTFAAPAGCKQQIRLEIPVTVQENLVPVTEARLNGHDVTFIIDSGAFFSMLSPSSAAELQLHLRPAPAGYFIAGVTGAAGKIGIKLTSATLTLGGATFPTESDFIVAGNDFGEGPNGLLGQNVLGVADVEYDLANGMVRLIKREGDCRNTIPTYWAKPGDAYSGMDIKWPMSWEPHVLGIGFLNGAKIRVAFDTGANTSILSLEAAERAGIKTTSPGVTYGGTSFGISRGVVKTWIAPFQSFKIGAEEIRNTHLRIADLELGNTDMLVGADFFQSHRVYVARSEAKLYFTYNGGPVFNLKYQSEAGPAAKQKTDTIGAPAPAPENPPASDTPSASSETKPTADNVGAGGEALGENASDDPVPRSPGASQGATASNTTIPGVEPTRADEFFRRGAADVARGDYAHALADLQRACEMNPQEPKYFLERATVYWYTQQKDRSDADIDTALKLKPDYLDARLWRAHRELTRHDTVAAIADLDAADRAALAQENMRLALASLYQHAEAFPQAIKQYTLWIDSHGQDVRLLSVYTKRCWARALSGQELDQALSDCHQTLHVAWREPVALATRGLVYLRLGQFSSAISDYDAALKQRPKNAWALYGRGLAESKLNKTAAAATDFNAANAINSHIAADFEKHGIAP